MKDGENPENEGKVKILRFGRQLHKIIMEAIEGDDADEFGERIFDFSDKGCNLRIKVEEQGGYPTYVSSRFASPSEIPGIDENNVGTVYDQVHDLENVFPVKTYEELETMLQEHYYGKNTPGPAPITAPGHLDPAKSSSTIDETDDIVFDDDKPNASADMDDEKVKQLLDTLEP